MGRHVRSSLYWHNVIIAAGRSTCRVFVFPIWYRSTVPADCIDLPGECTFPAPRLPPSFRMGERKKKRYWKRSRARAGEITMRWAEPTYRRTNRRNSVVWFLWVANSSQVDDMILGRNPFVSEGSVLRTTATGSISPAFPDVSRISGNSPRSRLTCHPIEASRETQRRWMPRYYYNSRIQLALTSFRSNLLFSSRLRGMCMWNA